MFRTFRPGFLASTLIALALPVVGTVPAAAEDAEPFDPLASFPAESRFVLSIPDVSALRDDGRLGRFVEDGMASCRNRDAEP